jgi:putative ABC transport system ATP-binding protein
MFNLVPYLSVLENVMLPCRFSRRRHKQASENGAGVKARAVYLLKKIGMDEAVLSGQTAIELSVGQQQRVAAARALIGMPEIIIADEPTSSLDTDHRESFIRLLFNECEHKKNTIIFVSHDTNLENLFDRTIRLADINLSAGERKKP